MCTLISNKYILEGPYFIWQLSVITYRGLSAERMGDILVWTWGLLIGKTIRLEVTTDNCQKKLMPHFISSSNLIFKSILLQVFITEKIIFSIHYILEKLLAMYRLDTSCL